jgi:hypothetical protein
MSRGSASDGAFGLFNAADACEKLRYESISQLELFGEDTSRASPRIKLLIPRGL